MLASKFLSPKNDFAFKKIFGSAKNKDILIPFLNDMLEFKGAKQIKEVVFLKSSQDPEIAAAKQSLVDVLCTDELQRQYIIEMQVAKTEGFEKRAQYYAAKAYSQQLMQGEGYHQLKEIIFLAITDFVMFPDKTEYKSDHVILDKKSYSHDLKDFSFTFVELPKFTKSITELSSIREKWVYFFKHANETSEAELEVLVGSDIVLKRAYEELNYFSWSANERNVYEQVEKRDRDNRAVLAYQMKEAREEGLAKGKAEGLAEGKAEGLALGKVEGLAKGKAEGLAEGEKSKAQDIAKKLLLKNYSIEDITELTGLSEHVLNDIKDRFITKT